MKIFKYPVPLDNKFIIKMPLRTIILSFQVQCGVMNIWAAVDENLPLEERYFSLCGTGHDIDMNYVKKFIGTVQLDNGDFVWHLFELLGEK